MSIFKDVSAGFLEELLQINYAYLISHGTDKVTANNDYQVTVAKHD